MASGGQPIEIASDIVEWLVGKAHTEHDGDLGVALNVTLRDAMAREASARLEANQTVPRNAWSSVEEANRRKHHSW
jgi:hypothetical protein